MKNSVKWLVGLGALGALAGLWYVRVNSPEYQCEKCKHLAQGGRVAELAKKKLPCQECYDVAMASAAGNMAALKERADRGDAQAQAELLNYPANLALMQGQWA